VFGVYVWLGGTLRASDRGRSALPTCIRKPQTPKPSCLPACCLLPVIIMDWTVSIHLCRQVRQSALCKQVVKAKPSPAPKGGPPCCSVPVPSTRWAASGASPPLKTSCVCRYQDKLTHAHVRTCAT